MYHGVPGPRSELHVYDCEPPKPAMSRPVMRW